VNCSSFHSQKHNQQRQVTKSKVFQIDFIRGWQAAHSTHEVCQNCSYTVIRQSFSIKKQKQLFRSLNKVNKNTVFPGKIHSRFRDFIPPVMDYQKIGKIHLNTHRAYQISFSFFPLDLYIILIAGFEETYLKYDGW